jgi:hypothetical protein
MYPTEEQIQLVLANLRRYAAANTSKAEIPMVNEQWMREQLQTREGRQFFREMYKLATEHPYPTL